jgi:hypothetical protein
MSCKSGAIGDLATLRNMEKYKDGKVVADHMF